MRVVLRVIIALAALSVAGCASLGPRPELPVASAVPAGTGTALDEVIAAVEAQHPGESGFRLVSEGPEAFAIRARSALGAGRSVDVQTYIWHNDLTGGFLAYRLLEAADRGVKVRLLVDDMDARAKNYAFAALDAHPNIEVRMFNPFRSRAGKLTFAIEALGSFDRINRRMHNKTWIADNRIALVGGRNLGNEYFGASDEVNFVDLDFAMVGPIVREISASFDAYWNSPAAYPMDALAPGDVSPAALDALRTRVAPKVKEAETSRYAAELQNNDALQRLVAGDWQVHWSSNTQFVADDPLKVEGKGGGVYGSRVLEALGPATRASRQKLTVISPYFVPGKAGTEALVSIDQAGSDVRVLTNSLAANDVAAVYGGYSKWRKPLLEGGVRLWELKPVSSGSVDSSLFGSKGASLHTKALTVDGSMVFVGSFNLDPRSTALNCEQGVLVENAGLAAQLEELFSRESAGAKSWSVTLEHGELHWTDDLKTVDSTPQASAWRKFQAWLGRVLPISSQL